MTETTTTGTTIEAMAKAIEDLINAEDYVSFAELNREVPGFAPSADAPAVGLRVGKRPIWVMSAAGSEALWLLFDQLRACATPSSPLTYLIDGASLKSAKWAPMTLRPGRYANFIGPGGLPLYAPEKQVAGLRRQIARDQKAGRPHGTEIKRAAP